MSLSKIIRLGSAALPFGVILFWMQGGVIYGRSGFRVVKEENPEVFYLCCGLAALLGLVLIVYAFKKEPIQPLETTRGK
ncbi:MAG: hypothetical protein HYX71_01400 [Opitutae bacterium]|nr:hypothetical protein [Opitutae bacterium]